MAQSFPETAHNRINKEEFDKNYREIYGEVTRVRAGSFKWKDGKIVEITAEESKRSKKHATAGLCGEYGMSELAPCGGLAPNREHKEQPRFTCPHCNYDQNRFDDFCENCTTKL